MKISFKKISTVCFLLAFTLSALAQVNSSDALENQEEGDFFTDFFEDTEEVNCGNLVDVFEEYNNTVALMEKAFSNSLGNMYQFFGQIEEEKSLRISEIQSQKQQVENTQNVISDSGYSISSQGNDILFVLEGCLKK